MWAFMHVVSFESRFVDAHGFYLALESAAEPNHVRQTRVSRTSVSFNVRGRRVVRFRERSG